MTVLFCSSSTVAWRGRGPLMSFRHLSIKPTLHHILAGAACALRATKPFTRVARFEQACRLGSTPWCPGRAQDAVET